MSNSHASLSCRDLLPAGSRPHLVATHSQIPEPRRTHGFWFVNVPQIYDVRIAHQLLETIDIEPAKLVPLGYHDQSICAASRVILIFAVENVRHQPAGCVHSS